MVTPQAGRAALAAAVPQRLPAILLLVWAALVGVAAELFQLPMRRLVHLEEMAGVAAVEVRSLTHHWL
jgi:hypothetical protein